MLALGLALAAPLAADEGEIVWGGSVPLTGIYAQVVFHQSNGKW